MRCPVRRTRSGMRLVDKDERCMTLGVSRCRYLLSPITSSVVLASHVFTVRISPSSVDLASTSSFHSRHSCKNFRVSQTRAGSKLRNVWQTLLALLRNKGKNDRSWGAEKAGFITFRCRLCAAPPDCISNISHVIVWAKHCFFYLERTRSSPP